MLSRASLKSIIFGLEDSLVSTTGLVVGVAIGSHNKSAVILAGVVGLCVEAVSMASGEFLSQTSGSTQKKFKLGLIMFISYLFGGLFPIIPIFFSSLDYLIVSCVLSSLFGLGLLGWGKGLALNENPRFSALQVLFIGGLSMAIGLAAGKLVGFSP